MIIIDATDLVLGRLATVTAKKALLGEEVAIVNAGKAIITGSKKQVLTHYREHSEKGSMRKGPFFRRQPERFVKRAIRGMLPYKQAKGRVALDRIKCYRGIPKEFEGKSIISLENAHAKNLSIGFVTVNTICKEMGGSL
ncbi:MAG: 50S ribosomal protein L13 [archaeon]